MRLTYKYRLFPTSAQRTSLERVLELCRWVYNDTLAARKNAYEQEQKLLGLYDTNKLLTQWKAAKPALKAVHSQVLQNVQERVDLAFKAFFRRVKAGEEPGYPRFKGKGLYDSFTFKQSGFKLVGNKLTLSKVGDVRVKLHRPICADIKTLTIQRDSVGNWYACFSCECETRPLGIRLEPTPNVIGIDLGLTTLQICSGCSSSVPKDLSLRIHDCPHCGLKLSRDHNAALNILARGLASINALTGLASVAAPELVEGEVVEAPGFSRGE